MPTRDEQPVTIVIFGATGDLARRKLIPALFSNHLRGRLPRRFSIVGFSGSERTEGNFREHLRQGFVELAPEASWALMDPLVRAAESPHGPPIEAYEPGCWGPPEADRLLGRDGRVWRMGCIHGFEPRGCEGSARSP